MTLQLGVLNDFIAMGHQSLHQGGEAGDEKSWVGFRGRREGILYAKVKLPTEEGEPATAAIRKMLGLLKLCQAENPSIETHRSLFLPNGHRELQMM
jgi:hypothetical protein